MAVTLTAQELAAALRVGDTAEETAEATRLLAYATRAVQDYLGDPFTDAPEVVVNEAVVRLAAYLFDMPTTNRGAGYGNALRNSGAGRMLLPYRVHRAGLTNASEAVAAAQTVSFSLGLREVGAVTVTVSAVDVWEDTGLELADGDIGGVSVVYPDGSYSGIRLFDNAIAVEPLAVHGEATGLEFTEFAIGGTAEGTLAFAAAETGDHVVTLYGGA